MPVPRRLGTTGTRRAEIAASGLPPRLDTALGSAAAFAPMRAPSDPVPELHPAAIADLIDRLEDVAHLLAWELPEARDCEHYMALDLGRMRTWEAASVIATLAEMARPVLCNGVATGFATELRSTGQHEAVR